jgi:hypothetical protein
MKVPAALFIASVAPQLSTAIDNGACCRAVTTPPAAPPADAAAAPLHGRPPLQPPTQPCHRPPPTLPPTFTRPVSLLCLSHNTTGLGRTPPCVVHSCGRDHSCHRDYYSTNRLSVPLAAHVF